MPQIQNTDMFPDGWGSKSIIETSASQATNGPLKPQVTQFYTILLFCRLVVYYKLVPCGLRKKK